MAIFLFCFVFSFTFFYFPHFTPLTILLDQSYPRSEKMVFLHDRAFRFFVLNEYGDWKDVGGELASNVKGLRACTAMQSFPCLGHQRCRMIGVQIPFV